MLEHRRSPIIMGSLFHPKHLWLLHADSVDLAFLNRCVANQKWVVELFRLGRWIVGRLIEKIWGIYFAENNSSLSYEDD